MAFPFDFVVAGLPISHQTRNRAKLRQWVADVLAAAQAAWPPGEAPSQESIELTVVTYYDTTSPDVDNFHKPIQDALQGLVYVNDSQITDAHPSKRNINGKFEVRGMPPLLAQAFVDGDEFVHVHVDLAPDHARLIQ